MCSSGEVRNQRAAPDGGGSKKASLAGAGIRTGVSTSQNPRVPKNARTVRSTSARWRNVSKSIAPESIIVERIIAKNKPLSDSDCNNSFLCS